MTVFLDPDTFRTVVASTPLISIDLVVQNPGGEILLGRRVNRPAQGCWFVPGGRVLKDETLDGAFERLTEDELGFCRRRSEASFLGVYEHLYADSVFSAAPDGGPSTHYVVLGYHLRLDKESLNGLPRAQHERYRWWPVDEVSVDPAVHDNTRAYLPAVTRAAGTAPGRGGIS
ncbi:GDP-mannose mannosyl hydrolase [Desulfuromonas sp.]|uniref:GDP-mannose mannosyl hydrolase n=1 Tax=Desulfuromonas sp. TaxID=892 RepID=UPI0025B8E7F3|nr:GDP-mannose mannosyl hydrolase [Desulfuromonas sp.]